MAFGIAIFAGAFLLFLVQPMVGKYILPWFGGGAGVWSACLLFFQVGLLAGYAYAHLLARRLAPRRQAVVHLAVLLAGIAFLPVIPAERFKPAPGADPVLAIALLLGATVGVPYVALAATGPLMQSWFSRARPGVPPWRLYALSNAGSLLPLLAYPFVIEPLTTRRAQAWGWSVAFVGFAAAVGLAARALSSAQADPAAKRHEPHDRTPHPSPSPSWVTRALWLLLPAFGVILLLAGTHRMSEEVAPVPFLWVAPLAAYLVTLIVAFEWPRLYARAVAVPALLAALWGLSLLVRPTTIGFFTQLASQMAILFACCLVCHGELYRLRPPVDRLTSYYLAIAAGGAAGGAFVALAAPRLFTSYAEYRMAAFGTLALLLVSAFREPVPKAARARRALAALAAVLAATGAGVALDRELRARSEGVVLAVRNFYGTLRVVVRDPDDPSRAYTRLEVGRIAHGAQVGDPARRDTPLMYYGPDSGVAQLLSAHATGTRRIGVIGLGVGTIAAFARPGDTVRFYEIDPDVVRIARERFTFLADCRGRAEVAVGDGRLVLESERPQAFDVLVLDAFTGDAVPGHLLTRQAFDAYLRHVAPGGAIAVNVSNRYIDLARMVVPLAEGLGLTARIVHTPRRPGQLIQEATWILLARDAARISAPAIDGATVPGADLRRVRPWTDDYVSLFAVLK